MRRKLNAPVMKTTVKYPITWQTNQLSKEWGFFILVQEHFSLLRLACLGFKETLNSLQNRLKKYISVNLIKILNAKLDKVYLEFLIWLPGIQSPSTFWFYGLFALVFLGLLRLRNTSETTTLVRKNYLCTNKTKNHIQNYK